MNNEYCILCGHVMEKHQAYSVWHENTYRIRCNHEVGQREEPCNCNAGFKDVKITVTMD